MKKIFKTSGEYFKYYNKNKEKMKNIRTEISPSEIILRYERK